MPTNGFAWRHDEVYAAIMKFYINKNEKAKKKKTE